MQRLTRKALPALTGLVLSIIGCQSANPAVDSSDRLAVDSMVVDLFSLGARLRLMGGNARLTALGKSLLTDTMTPIQDGNILLNVDRPVRAFSAYARHDVDILCDPTSPAKDTLFIQLDDELDLPCHDTAQAWAPGYPYRKPMTAAYLEGRGFWISGADVPFARGELIIHFDYLTGASHVGK